MKMLFDKYPIDIILCILCSFFLIPIAFMNLNEILQIILGLPFIFFIPGYVLIFSLFPTKKTDIGINLTERIALSIGFSIAIVSIIGLGLNYSSFGIQLESIFLSIFVLIIGLGALGIYKWFKLEPYERFIINFEITKLKSKSKIDFFLNLLIIFSIIIVITVVTYFLIAPKQIEKFTEFYFIGSQENTTIFPREILREKNYSVIIGVANHEYSTIDYTLEVWLINQSDTGKKTIFQNRWFIDKILIKLNWPTNQSEVENKIIIQNMWFVDKILVRLNHSDVDINNINNGQWEYPYTFNINKTGSFKLTFLLFTTSTDDYIKDLDYKEISEEKINNAYREIHLWINVR